MDRNCTAGSGGELERLVSEMDAERLRKAIGHLADEVGGDAVMECLRRSAPSIAGTDRGLVFSRVWSSTNLSEGEIVARSRESSWGCTDPELHAYDILTDVIRAEFGPDVGMLLRMGSREAASGLLLTVADCLENLRGTLACLDPGCGHGYAEHIRANVAAGRLDRAL